MKRKKRFFGEGSLGFKNANKQLIPIKTLPVIRAIIIVLTAVFLTTARRRLLARPSILAFVFHGDITNSYKDFLARGLSTQTHTHMQKVSTALVTCNQRSSLITIKRKWPSFKCDMQTFMFGCVCVRWSL